MQGSERGFDWACNENNMLHTAGRKSSFGSGFLDVSAQASVLGWELGIRGCGFGNRHANMRLEAAPKQLGVIKFI